MAVKVLNKSKAICDVCTYEGGSVILKPGHALVLSGDVSDVVVNFYKAYEKIGLKVIVEEPVPVEEPKQDTEPEEATNEQIDEVEYSEKELSKKTKAQLIQIAEDLGIENLEGLSKSQIISAILNE